MSTLFLAALLTPLLGPVLYGLLHRRDRAMRLVDGSVYLAVPALVLWQVLPSAWELQSPAILVSLALGVLVPTVAERVARPLAERTDDVAIVVGLSGLVLHALLEGAAFSTGAAVEPAFGAAVILHRIPLGLVIWWLLRPRHGVLAACAGVGILVAATLAGYALGGGVLTNLHGLTTEMYQAFVSGSLVHVVFHQGRHDHQHHHHPHHPSQPDR